jgi:hypothetical protein
MPLPSTVRAFEIQRPVIDTPDLHTDSSVKVLWCLPIPIPVHPLPQGFLGDHLIYQVGSAMRAAFEHSLSVLLLIHAGHLSQHVGPRLQIHISHILTLWHGYDFRCTYLFADLISQILAGLVAVGPDKYSVKP